MKRLASILAVAALLGALAPAATAAPLLTRVAQGELLAKREGTVAAYLGVPFAAPPVGPLRWRPPQPAAPWPGLRKAQAFGDSCAQEATPAGFRSWSHEYMPQNASSEDCLFLNIWTAARPGARRPVLVWIHGGGFTAGSGEVPIYDGRALAARGVVVVTINYRLGVFGFLAHPALTAEAGASGGAPGNWGLQDQVAALQWVRANIAAFGGDPGQVTIAGQSAGSMAVQMLLVSPAAKGLFRRAISESGLPSAAPPATLATAEQAGLAFQQSLGAGSLADLRALPTAAFLTPAARAAPFRPIVDGVLLPDAPAALAERGAFHDVPVLVGQVANEISPLSGETSLDAAGFQAFRTREFDGSADAFARFYPAQTDAERLAMAWRMQQDLGRVGLYLWAKTRAAHGTAPIYPYYYDHTEPGPEAARWRSFHSAEIPYVFQTFAASPERGFTVADQAISRDMSTRWLNFVRTGDPNGGGGDWPRFDPARPRIMGLGDKPGPQPVLPPDRLGAIAGFVAGGGQAKMF